MARPQRFTIYDMMEAKGYFDSNPANVSSRDSEGAALYKGPVEYPKMLYSPKGEQRITQTAEIVMTPIGPKELGEQRELISRIVNNPAEEKSARLAGWHDHPAKSIAAGGREAPPISAATRIDELHDERRRMQEEIDELRAQLATQGAGASTGTGLGTLRSVASPKAKD